jgi:site-specific recombinase XerD
VAEFLRYLAPTRKQGTVKGYKATLRRFHEWLAERRIESSKIDRETCLAWGRLLYEQGLHPATRVGMMVCVRKYVDWLWERGVTAAPGRDLILGSDLPKKPEYLPRPLPAENDRELQQKLKDDQSKVGLGLYVMRRTGLRIGELRQLDRDCVRVDHSGGHFLTVPLGKMNNERLVPLDPATLDAVVELQAQAQDQESRWLFEGSRARPVSMATFQSNLVRVAGDMSLAEPLTTHRLRHSFATSLMNGGMSLVGIMKLLGHRDQRMTMRYAQIADETVGREYFEALARVSARYAAVGAASEVVSDPLELLQDVIRWLTKELCVGRTERHARLLVRRLEAARADLATLCSEAGRAS